VSWNNLGGSFPIGYTVFVASSYKRGSGTGGRLNYLSNLDLFVVGQDGQVYTNWGSVKLIN
jgi:hypothetical protein